MNGGHDANAILRWCFDTVATHLLCTILFASVVACASNTRATPERTTSDPGDHRIVRIALPSPEWATSTRPLELESVMREALESNGGGVVESKERVASFFAKESATCTDEPACIRRVGGALAVHKVVLVKLAELAGTVVVHGRMVDVAGNAPEETLQEVVRAATPERIAEVVRSMGISFAKPFEPPPAWYERWWVWTIAAAVIAGAFTAIGFTLLSGEPGPDLTITPP